MSANATPVTVPSTDVLPEVDSLQDFLPDVCACLRDAAHKPTIGNLSAAMDAMSTLRSWPDERASATLTTKKNGSRTLSAKGWYSCLSGSEPSRGILIRENARKPE